MSCPRRELSWNSTAQDTTPQDVTSFEPPPDPDRDSRRKLVAETQRVVAYSTMCASDVTMALVRTRAGTTITSVDRILVRDGVSCIVTRIDSLGRHTEPRGFIQDPLTHSLGTRATTLIDSRDPCLSPAIFLDILGPSGAPEHIEMLVDPKPHPSLPPTETETFYRCSFALRTHQPIREISLTDWFNARPDSDSMQ